jgi:hypothetical protein
MQDASFRVQSEGVRPPARPSQAGAELWLTVVAPIAAAITPNVFVAGGLRVMSASALAKAVVGILFARFLRDAGTLVEQIAAAGKVS